MPLFDWIWIFYFPAAPDGTLKNKMTLVFYVMYEKGKIFCLEFAQVRRHVFFLLMKCIFIYLYLTFKLLVKFVRHAYHMWFLLIFYDDVCSEVAKFASMFGQPADYESIYLFGLNIAEEYVKILSAYYLESPQCSPLRTATSVKMSTLAWIRQMHVQFPQCHNRNNSANSVFGNPSIGPILSLSLLFPEIIAFHRNVLCRGR